MKKLLGAVFLFFLIGSADLSASVYDPALQWKTIQTDHFRVNHPDNLEAQAKRISGYLEDAYKDLTPKFGWEPWLRTEVIVTDNNDASNGMSSVLPYNWMLLRLVAPDPDSVLADYDDWLRTLVYHEYTHILHLDQIGGAARIPRLVFGKVISPNGSTPGWIREGIATYIETVETDRGRGRASYSEMMLRTAVLNKNFLKIDEADGLGWEWPAYQSMYIYGVKFTDWLAKKYGEEKIMEFHRRTGRSPLLFAVNHQARHVFGKPEFELKKVHNRYMKVKKEGAPKSKTFYDLWREWREELEKKYAEDIAQIEAKGLTVFEDVAAGGTVLSSPTVSPDGNFLVYSRSRVKGPAELRLINLQSGLNEIIKKRKSASAISFSPDSKKFVFSAGGAYKTYNYFSDLHTYDLETKKFEQITKGMRASDPVFSPDGKKVLFVKQSRGRSFFAVYDIVSKETTDIVWGDSPIEQVANPAFSKDGKKIVFSGHEGRSWNIFVAEISDLKFEISNFKKLTEDAAIDSRPVFSPDGGSVYYSSDKTGISNIHKVSVPHAKAQRPRSSQITNVLTGVFQPAVSPDGKTMYVQYYNGHGYDIRSFGLERQADIKSGDVRPAVQGGAKTEKIETLTEPTLSYTPKKYVPLGKSLLLPRFIIPNITTFGDAIFLGAFTGGADPLRWHNWTVGVNYRTDYKNYLGYFFNYWYNRFKPAIGVGVMEYAVKFANIPVLCESVTPGPPDVCNGLYSKSLFEKRLRTYTGINHIIGKHFLHADYFYENRKSNLSDWENTFLNTYYPAYVPDLGKYAGFGFTYVYGNTERYPASISPQHGRRFRGSFTVTNKNLGSSDNMEQEVFVGDYREYIDLPWLRQVIAFRTSGGITWGDQFKQGTFSLGGALGEGVLGGGDSLYYFPLRGLPTAALSNTRALLFSLEYRFPLTSLQRGLGTTPFYVKEIHFAPFLDYGDSWNAGQEMFGNGSYFFDQFFLSAGAEVRGDFVIGHGLPFTGRMGYGVVVVNRDRISSTSKDALLDTPTKDGVFILQLGTSF